MAKFISKRANVNFEGCAFRMYTYSTEEPERIQRLRRSYWYDKDFIELRDGEEVESTNGEDVLSSLTTEEIERILRERRASVDYSEWKYQDLYNEAKKRGESFSKRPTKDELIGILNG
jgi:hypothetical protein